MPACPVPAQDREGRERLLRPTPRSASNASASSRMAACISHQEPARPPNVPRDEPGSVFWRDSAP